MFVFFFLLHQTRKRDKTRIKIFNEIFLKNMRLLIIISAKKKQNKMVPVIFFFELTRQLKKPKKKNTKDVRFWHFIRRWRVFIQRLNLNPPPPTIKDREGGVVVRVLKQLVAKDSTDKHSRCLYIYLFIFYRKRWVRCTVPLFVVCYWRSFQSDSLV